uniref:Centrosomal protein of 290kDa coiled-coil region domain-containing protein n=1 Tax=Timema tahoe TaxID=61484 RepID=A0A7R9NUL7_9NEOP|nr:unnamed protein product [Timema tahoe]
MRRWRFESQSVKSRMVELDWKKLSSLSPEDLTEEEKDDLYEKLIWYIPEPNTASKKLFLLLKINQEVLKHKGEQVESLETELDEIAARQGEEEARTHQRLVEELDELRTKLSRYRAGEDHNGSINSDIEELRQELARSESHNEELEVELKAREKDWLSEKREVEKLTSQLVSLDHEKEVLHRELSALQSEASEQQESRLRQTSPELGVEKQREMAESIRQKNKHISQLLNDLEAVEKENRVLQEKLTSLRDELSEATRHMTEVTGELTSLRHTCQEREDKLNTLEEQNFALRTQVKELVDQKLDRDSRLDHFSEALDTRVQEWKRVMEEKDAEIEELQSRLSLLAAQAPNIQIDTERSRVALLTQTLQKQEDQIEDLQNKLTQATKELNEGAAIIEQLGSRRSKLNSSEIDAVAAGQLKAVLQQTEERVRLLEGKLKDAEEDAQAKAQEMTEMIVKLREYESGEYGLMEAVDEIKQLRKQRQLRDRQIEELIQSSNKLQEEATSMEEQNMALREKLGISAENPLRVDGILAQRKKEQLLVKVLQQQSERLGEDKLHLQLENRRLCKRLSRLCEQLKSLGQSPDVSTLDEQDSVLALPAPEDKELIRADMQLVISEAVSSSAIGRLTSMEAEVKRVKEERDSLKQGMVYIEEKLLAVTKENEALRTGMHEILDSVRSQDGSSDVRLESQCLERLLEALDSRHISGWYHPAMRLQAQVHTLEGNNTALRDQLRATRLEENKSREQAQKALLKIEHLEQKLASLEDSKHSSVGVTAYREMGLPPNLSLSSAEVIANLNMHLLRVLNEYHTEEERNRNLESRLEELNEKFNIVRHQTGLLYRHHGEEKIMWESKQREFETEKNVLKDNVARLEAKVTELDSHWSKVDSDSDTQMKLLEDSARRVSDMSSSLIIERRKCKALQDQENQLCKENGILKQQLVDMEVEVRATIGNLRRQKEMLTYQVSALQSSLQDSVPLTTLETTNRQYNELTSKYRDLLQNENSLMCEGQMAARLQGEVDILLKDKEELQSALQAAREKLHSLEVIVTSLSQDTVTQDTHDNQISLLSKKLAALELKELNEKQRADHADKMYKILKEQIIQLEERNSELESRNSTLVAENSSLHQVERELRDDLVTFVSREELEDVTQKLKRVEKQGVELRLEKDKMQEMTDIAQDQIRTLESWKVSHELQFQFMKEQILNLQAHTDDKATIAKLSHDMMLARLDEAAAKKRSHQLSSEVTRLRALNLRLDSRLEEKDREMSQLWNQFSTRCRTLHQVIQGLRRQYSGAVSLSTQERRSISLHRLVEERREWSEKLRAAEKLAHDATLKTQELEIQTQAVQELRVSLSSTHKHKQLAEWHNKNTELRIKEAKCQRKAEFLELQLVQAEERLRRQEEHICSLEDKQARLEKDWEEAQLLWEQTHIDLCKQLSQYEGQQQHKSPRVNLKSPPTQPKSPPAPQQRIEKDVEPIKEESPRQGKIPEAQTSVSTETSNEPAVSFTEQLIQAMSLIRSQSQSLLKYEGELAQLRTKLSSSSHEAQERVDQITVKDKLITELRSHLAMVQESAAAMHESTDKLALKTTVESLQNIVSQKEETIARYQQLLKDARTEHSEAARRFQEEIQSQQMTIINHEQAYSRAKGLGDEVSELQTAMSNLGNQLTSCKQESDRWRNMAEDRLRNMGELRQSEENTFAMIHFKWVTRNKVGQHFRQQAMWAGRLEDQHQSELSSYQEESNNCRTTCEHLKQELASVRHELRQRVDELGQGPSAILKNNVAILKAQLQEKDARVGQLSQNVIDLQIQLKTLVQSAAREASSNSQMMGVELVAREEEGEEGSTGGEDVNNLRAQLYFARDKIKKLQEQLSARLRVPARRDGSADRRISAKEELLQKRIKTLEGLLQEKTREQDKEKADIEFRKIKSAEEVARWDERKKWQQSTDKLKQLVKDKSVELDKLESTITSLKDTVTRLEREKLVLASRLKSTKGSESSELEKLELERSKLQVEVTTLKNKLEMQQRHAGGLGAAILEERLEAQQRRIATLELAKKGNLVVAEELDKLKESNSTLHKANLRLESENLELRLDHERSRTDTPRLREQIQHLEKYVTLLQTENSHQKKSSSLDEDTPSDVPTKGKKSSSELEKTIVVLKRVVEKLQSENKRLREGKKTDHSNTKESVEKLRVELLLLRVERKKLEDRYLEGVQTTTQLEAELVTSRKHIKALEDRLQAVRGTSTEQRDSDTQELLLVRTQLIHKSQLLEKVKSLLKRAAMKEKTLQEQVRLLQSLVPAGVLQEHQLNSLSSEKEKEILVNPNCPVRVMVDYIRSVMNESNLNQVTNTDFEIDLCDENGSLKNLQEIPPWTNGIEANLFTPRLTYIVVVFERDEEGGLVKPMPLVARSSRQYNDLIAKIRRQLNPSVKKINKNESKQNKEGSKTAIVKKSGDRVLPK